LKPDALILNIWFASEKMYCSRTRMKYGIKPLVYSNDSVPSSPLSLPLPLTHGLDVGPSPPEQNRVGNSISELLGTTVGDHGVRVRGVEEPSIRTRRTESLSFPIPAVLSNPTPGTKLGSTPAARQQKG
jgi:hypothetical protein